jgi:FkbM family methyltransferase
MAVSHTVGSRIKRLLRIMIGRDAPFFVQEYCQTEWHGSTANGWVICPDLMGENMAVYSLGIGQDISFDLSLIQKYGANVYAFDPTPSSLAWLKTQNVPKKFHYYEFGVADYEGRAVFYPPRTARHASRSMIARPTEGGRTIEVPVRRLSDIVAALGHSHIDLLKMDIEGAEYGVIDNMLLSGIRPKQLLVEFHHKFPSLGVRSTKKTVGALMREGYRIFYVSPRGEEYSFLRVDE